MTWSRQCHKPFSAPRNAHAKSAWLLLALCCCVPEWALTSASNSKYQWPSEKLRCILVISLGAEFIQCLHVCSACTGDYTGQTFSGSAWWMRFSINEVIQKCQLIKFVIADFCAAPPNFNALSQICQNFFISGEKNRPIM